MIELKETRVYRPFVGGRLLDEFGKKKVQVDDHWPERWLGSVVEAGGNEGLSYSLSGKPLKDLANENIDVLAKLIDSATRLMIQVHPTKEKAEKLFNYPYGKTEAWYVLDTRDDLDPYVFLGFKEGITRDKWREAYKNQDIPMMENMLHRIKVSKGDIFLIPSGTVHAMGPGVFFAEVQEPCDITLRPERISPDGRVMDDFSMTHGASDEDFLSCFDYEGLSYEETCSKYMIKRKENTIVSTSMFSLEEYTVKPGFKLDVDRFAIILCIEGRDKGREFYTEESTALDIDGKILVFRGSR